MLCSWPGPPQCCSTAGTAGVSGTAWSLPSPLTLGVEYWVLQGVGRQWVGLEATFMHVLACTTHVVWAEFLHFNRIRLFSAFLVDNWWATAAVLGGLLASGAYFGLVCGTWTMTTREDWVEGAADGWGPGGTCARCTTRARGGMRR